MLLKVGTPGICLLFNVLLVYVYANTISTEKGFVEFQNVRSVKTCENYLPTTFCEDAALSGSCTSDDPNEKWYIESNCEKSCKLCQHDSETTTTKTVDSYDSSNILIVSMSQDSKRSNCEDKVPDCIKYLSVCCSMKDAMNVTCRKTCKFCSETIAPTPPGNPGFGMGQPAPTAATDQDPCDPTKPPSATVEVPGQPSTTTQSAISTLLPLTTAKEIPVGSGL